MSAVLVTGGAGYIGSHVCKALADFGLTPICYDTLEKGHRWAVRWGPLEQGDIGEGLAASSNCSISEAISACWEWAASAGRRIRKSY